MAVRLANLSHAAALGGLLALSVSTAAAQEAPVTPRLEVGGQVMWLHLMEFSVVPRRTEIAGGARFTWNVTKQVAVESQVDMYPRDVPYTSKLQAVFGVKVGRRGQRIGVFGKLRPGFVDRRTGGGCAIPEGCVGTTWFALDAGAVVEAYPSRWLVARVDIGDTFVRLIDNTDSVGNIFPFSSHNAQVSVGVGLRF